MSTISNIRILTELGELIYKEVNDLNLSFSRIVDDFTDISNKYGDFSYDFNLPIIKENSLIFGSPESIGSKNYFMRNRNIGCQVYNNQQLILDGLINLESVTTDTYKCKFYSKFKELVDTINGTTATGDKKTLKDLNFPTIINWDYESSIITHINANYKNSDETFYQYPLSFYSTHYTENAVYTGKLSMDGSTFTSDNTKQNYYHLLNTVETTRKNRFYFHQLPPALYLVSIVKQIINDAGWSLGGQFFNDDNIKRIIYLFSGTDDIYDQAISGDTAYGSAPLNLNMGKFLPDMSQGEFLKGVMNYFNLYFRIDAGNKIIEFETYDTYFKKTDEIDPYDITYKVDRSTSTFNSSYFSSNNPSVLFKPALNRKVFGDNKVMRFDTNNPTTGLWYSVSNKTFNQTFNRVGFVEQSNVNLNNYVSTVTKIDLPFSEPTIKKHYIWNDYNSAGSYTSAGMQVFYLPILSKQTPQDNNSVKFNKADADTYLMNNESTIKFQGDGSLMYYYGPSTTDFENVISRGPLANYLFFSMYTGSTRFSVPIPIVSPFQLLSYRTVITDWLSQVNTDNIEDRRTPVASYLQALWQMMGNSTGVTESLCTDFSLVFDDNGYFHETLWSRFHKYKWDRYQNSELVTADMLMTSYDWNEMQINRPLLYRGELYSLVEIQGFNPVTQRATIKIIKKY